MMKVQIVKLNLRQLKKWRFLRPKNILRYILNILTSKPFEFSVIFIGLAILIGGLMSWNAVKKVKIPIEETQIKLLQFEEKKYQDVLLRLEERQKLFENPTPLVFRNLFEQKTTEEVLEK